MLVVLESIVPIFAVIFLGHALKRFGMIDDHFTDLSDSLLYFMFMPGLLFWKIAEQSPDKPIDWAVVLPAMAVIFAVFLGSLMYSRLMKMPNGKIGSFSQSCYRFSTYLGLAVVSATYGEKGVREFGILIAFLIPFINLLAVPSLIWYSSERPAFSKEIWILVKTVALNPLILACLAGLVYSRLRIPMPHVFAATLSMTSALALPLALLSIGGSLTLEKIKFHLPESVAAAGFKLILAPVLGYLVLKWLKTPAFSLSVAMIYFGLPTSPNNHILSAQLNSDVELAKAAMVLSTLISAASLSIILILFV
jgi:malonate transporter and related proteins